MRILLYVVLAIAVIIGLQLLLGSTSWPATIFRCDPGGGGGRRDLCGPPPAGDRLN